MRGSGVRILFEHQKKIKIKYMPYAAVLACNLL
jgi:hypothetical protein